MYRLGITDSQKHRVRIPEGAKVLPARVSSEAEGPNTGSVVPREPSAILPNLYLPLGLAGNAGADVLGEGEAATASQ